MRLLSSTDFALRVLMLLAREPPGTHLSVDNLSQQLGGLSRHHLHKIVQDLTSLNVTRTIRGAGGGVALAVAPEEIQIGTLVRQLEEDQPVVECFRSDGCSCTLLPACRLRGMLARARDGFYETLNQHHLGELMAENLS